MPQVEVMVGGRSFEVACRPGEEAFLVNAATALDAEAQAISTQIGRMPEARMLLMAGLMLADKAGGLEDRLRGAEARVAALEEALRDQEPVEVRVEVPVEVVVEVPVVPLEVAELMDEVAAEAEALARTVLALAPAEAAPGP